jgi:hypothetical protein
MRIVALHYISAIPPTFVSRDINIQPPAVLACLDRISEVPHANEIAR